MTVAKIVEISAESNKGFDDAIRHGVDRARKTLDGVKGAWLKDQQVEVGSDGTLTYRVSMKVTFLMNE
ncbi:MAG: dodecin family protein [Myxococcota bacterium]|nr:dodecin family protein [Myxococcota bacterium]